MRDFKSPCIFIFVGNTKLLQLENSLYILTVKYVGISRNLEVRIWLKGIFCAYAPFHEVVWGSEEKCSIFNINIRCGEWSSSCVSALYVRGRNLASC
jgi:hypothetical protein